MGHNNCSSKKLVWVIILLCAIFVLNLIINVLARSLYHDLGEDSSSRTLPQFEN